MRYTLPAAVTIKNTIKTLLCHCKRLINALQNNYIDRKSKSKRTKPFQLSNASRMKTIDHDIVIGFASNLFGRQRWGCCAVHTRQSQGLRPPRSWTFYAALVPAHDPLPTSPLPAAKNIRIFVIVSRICNISEQDTYWLLSLHMQVVEGTDFESSGRKSIEAKSFNPTIYQRLNLMENIPFSW